MERICKVQIGYPPKEHIMFRKIFPDPPSHTAAILQLLLKEIGFYKETKHIQCFWKKSCWRDLHCSYGVMRGLVLGGPTCIEVRGDLKFWGDLKPLGGPMTHLRTMVILFLS